MTLPTAYGTIPLGGALPEAYIEAGTIPALGGALESAYGKIDPAIQMTAAASGSNGITVADDDDIDFGTGDFFLHWEGSLPDWTPSATSRVIHKRQSDTIRYAFSVNTDGTLSVFARDAGGTIFSTTSTSAASISANQIAKITAAIVRESGLVAGSVAFYVNGTALGASVAITAATPTTINNTGALSICAANTAADGRLESNTISCIVGNFAPTAAEVLDLCTNGIPESWKWGSQTAKYASDFSAGADGFAATNNIAVAGNIDGIGGEDNWLRLTASGGSANSRRPATFGDSTQRSKNTRVSFKIYVPVGNATTTGVSIRCGTSFVSLLGTFIPTAGQVTTFTTEVPSGTLVDTIFSFYMRSTASATGSTSGDIVYIKDIIYTQTGATMALLPNSIPTSGALEWPDSTGNTGGGTLPAAGATKVTIRR